MIVVIQPTENRFLLCAACHDCSVRLQLFELLNSSAFDSRWFDSNLSNTSSWYSSKIIDRYRGYVLCRYEPESSQPNRNYTHCICIIKLKINTLHDSCSLFSLQELDSFVYSQQNALINNCFIEIHFFESLPSDDSLQRKV